MLCIQLLGDLRVVADGVDVTAAIRYRKGVALLGYLAVERDRQHPREQLADLLWPGLSMAAARTNLRQVLTALARVLNRDTGAGALLATKEAIGWFPGADTAIDLDALASCADGGRAPSIQTRGFEQRPELVRGEFLAGISVPDSAEFEGWLQRTRASIHLRATAFLERLCRDHERAQQLPLAIGAAERLVAIDPWHETHHRLLMRLLAQRGQSRAALAAFDALALNLRHELGAEPDAQTRQLRAEILTRSLARNAAGDEEPGTAGDQPRWITVLCCEAHSPLDDADRAAAQCGELLAQAAAHLRSAGACPLPPLGRRLLAWFSSPARGEAARHAALAALHIQRCAQAPTTLRIGIHSGMSLIQTVADLPQPIGEVADTAVHLPLHVKAGEIAISESTLRQISVHCQADPLGMRRPHSLAEPLAIHRLGDVGSTPRAVDAGPVLSPLVGRDAELAALTALWQDARRGRLRIALLIGEPGIGKARLMREIGRRASPDAVVHVLAARPESAARPFAPFAAWLAAAAGIRDEDAPTQRGHRLRGWLAGVVDDIRADALGAALSDLIDGGDADAPAQGACVMDSVRQRWSDALVELFGRIAAQRTPVICCDNAQWADTSTLELLPRLCRGAGLVMVSVRPEGIPPGLPTDVTPLVLRPLDEDASRAIVGAQCGDTVLPEAQLRELMQRGGGNPLFIEQLVRSAQRRSAGAELPPTLFDLVQAQLERIGTLKPLLQAAALLGQRFPARWLSRLVDSPDLSIDLEHACRSGLIEACEDGAYRFRHAQIQRGRLPDPAAAAPARPACGHPQTARQRCHDADRGARPAP